MIILTDKQLSLLPDRIRNKYFGVSYKNGDGVLYCLSVLHAFEELMLTPKEKYSLTLNSLLSDFEKSYELSKHTHSIPQKLFSITGKSSCSFLTQNYTASLYEFLNELIKNISNSNTILTENFDENIFIKYNVSDDDYNLSGGSIEKEATIVRTILRKENNAYSTEDLSLAVFLLWQIEMAYKMHKDGLINERLASQLIAKEWLLFLCGFILLHSDDEYVSAETYSSLLLYVENNPAENKKRKELYLSVIPAYINSVTQNGEALFYERKVHFENLTLNPEYLYLLIDAISQKEDENEFAQKLYFEMFPQSNEIEKDIAVQTVTEIINMPNVAKANKSIVETVEEMISELGKKLGKDREKIALARSRRFLSENEGFMLSKLSSTTDKKLNLPYVPKSKYEQNILKEWLTICFYKSAKKSSDEAIKIVPIEQIAKIATELINIKTSSKNDEIDNSLLNLLTVNTALASFSDVSLFSVVSLISSMKTFCDNSAHWMLLLNEQTKNETELFEEDEMVENEIQ